MFKHALHTWTLASHLHWHIENGVGQKPPKVVDVVLPLQSEFSAAAPALLSILRKTRRLPPWPQRRRDLSESRHRIVHPETRGYVKPIQRHNSFEFSTKWGHSLQLCKQIPEQTGRLQDR